MESAEKCPQCGVGPYQKCALTNDDEPCAATGSMRRKYSEKTMTLEETQKRINAMPAAMAAKGKRDVDVKFNLDANSGGWVMLTWKRLDESAHRDGWEYIRFGDLADIPGALDKADAWIASLPSIEKANMQEFMSALGAAVEKGKALNIDVDFVNPLVETMKRLSKNALTDQRAA